MKTFDCEFCGYELSGVPDNKVLEREEILVCKRCRKAAVAEEREALRFGVELTYSVFPRRETPGGREYSRELGADGLPVDFDVIASSIMAECFSGQTVPFRDSDPED